MKVMDDDNYNSTNRSYILLGSYHPVIRYGFMSQRKLYLFLVLAKHMLVNYYNKGS